MEATVDVSSERMELALNHCIAPGSFQDLLALAVI